MADIHRCEDAPLALKVERNMPGVTRPFSLTWLQALDPQIFTPVTWRKGRETTIRLRAPDDSMKINVARIISRYAGGVIELRDEAYELQHFETGNHQIAPFRYAFNNEGQLTDYDRNITPGGLAASIVSKIGSLVYMPGASIRASNYETGLESNFISVGTQWLESSSRLVAPSITEIAIAPSLLGRQDDTYQ